MDNIGKQIIRCIVGGCGESCKHYDLKSSCCKGYEEVAEQAEQIFAEYEEYKGLEEQGKLLKLPCRAGDTVYVILPYNSYITKAEVNKIEIKPSLYGGICCFVESDEDRFQLYRYFEADFNKTIFFTREQAELKGEIC